MLYSSPELPPLTFTYNNKVENKRGQNTAICWKQLQEIKIFLHLVLHWDPVAHRAVTVHTVRSPYYALKWSHDKSETNNSLQQILKKGSLILKPVFLFPQEPACQWSFAGCFPLATPWYSFLQLIHNSSSVFYFQM